MISSFFCSFNSRVDREKNNDVIFLSLLDFIEQRDRGYLDNYQRQSTMEDTEMK